MTFNIAQWRAWAPGLSSPDDWRQWRLGALMSEVQGGPESAPDVSFLPSLQRRRLGRLARMAFHVGWPLADGLSSLPLVFVSRHGETPRTFELLSQLACDEPLSPTQFSLSVHNAVIGLWSILRGETAEMTALAAAGDGLENGLMEACALLDEGAPAVLLIIAEEQPPAAYDPWIDDVPFAYAVGLLLTAGDDWSLSLGERACSPLDRAPATAVATPHALNLVRHLLDGPSVWHHLWKGRVWNWQRNR